MTRRCFTVEQADRTLPLVRRIVQDIVDGYGRWQALVRDFELATASSTAEAPDADADRLQREAQRLAVDIEGFVGELEQLGVEFKGYEDGLVDFPSEVDGRPIYLCWRLGEPAVQYWHEVNAGVAGRQSLCHLVA